MQRKFYPLLSLLFGLTLAISMLLALHPASAAPQSGPITDYVIQAGLAYLQTQQQADGGVLGLSGVSDPDTTARAVLAFVAAGQPVTVAISTEGKSMLDYLTAQAISYTHDTSGTLFPARAGLLLAAVSVAGANPSDVAGMDLAGELEASFQPNTGAYSTTASEGYSSGAASDVSQAWAILGLSLAGRSVPVTATQYLNHTQAPDGSWGMGDPDTTALGVTALLASQQVSTDMAVIQNALGFFHATQLDNGGWRPSWDTDPVNADSTGWIVQALLSAGENLYAESWTKPNGTPIAALLSLPKPDGSIGGTYANAYSTADALIGLAGRSLSSLGILPAEHQAGLAVFPGDGSVYTACVRFPESSLSGIELLQRSGLPVDTATDPNQGTAVCKIGPTGCPSSNCFCNMPNYWSYWQPGEDGWAYSVMGASQSQVADGGVEAWSWGQGNPPPLITFQNICAGVPFELPTTTPPSQAPTNIPQPSPTSAAPASTATSQPTPSASVNLGNLISYGIFAAIVIVLGLGIIYLMRSRLKK